MTVKFDGEANSVICRNLMFREVIKMLLLLMPSLTFIFTVFIIITIINVFARSLHLFIISCILYGTISYIM